MIQTRPHKFLGLQMAQNSFALIALNLVLTRLQPARIIEIGTRCGGLTAFLGIYTRQNQLKYVTYDVADKFLNDPALLKFLGVEFRQQNCFEHEEDIVEMIRGEGPTLILCDGGNKPKEFRTFSQYMKPGDVICAHDYHPDNEHPCVEWKPIAEIQDKDIEGLDLEPFCYEQMKKAAWVCKRKP